MPHSFLARRLTRFVVCCLFATPGAFAQETATPGRADAHASAGRLSVTGFRGDYRVSTTETTQDFTIG